MKLLEHSGFLVRERAHHFSRYDAAAFVRGDLKHQYVPRFEVRVFGGQVLLLLFGERNSGIVSTFRCDASIDFTPALHVSSAKGSFGLQP